MDGGLMQFNTYSRPKTMNETFLPRSSSLSVMMPSSSQQGTSSSLSSQLSGQLARPPLSKASTQLQLLSDRAGAARPSSSDQFSPNTTVGKVVCRYR